MPRKAAAPGEEDQLTATELKLLRAIATLMPEAPKIDYGEMAKLVNYNHAKNVKAAVNKLFERLKKQHNMATAAASSDAAEKATTPEADDDDEAVEESPKKSPVKKATAAKKGKAAAAAEEASDKEDSPTKKPATKNGTATAKKVTTPKKGVGKTTAPKKASVGGPKTPVKGKGKKAAKTEEVEEEAEAEGDAEADDNADAKSEDADKVMEDIEEAAGKSTQPPPADNELPVDIPTTVASPEALAAAVADPAKPMFHILIQGYDYSYAPFDVSAANRYKVTLREYLQWKEYNDYTFYCGPRPYSWEHLAQEVARKSSGKA